jgi:hypothetical protein
LNRLKSDGVEVDAEVPVSSPAGGSADARQKIHQRMSALELGKRSIHGPLVYVVCALITVLGSSIRSDYPLASILVVVFLGILALVRIQYAKGFEARYDRVGERAVRNFVILLLIQCSIFSWSAAATIIHYGEGVESTYALLFGAAAGAVGTSSLAPRVGVHRIFLVAVMAPILAALVPGLGEVGIGILIGSSALVAFYLREVVLASAAYNGLIDTQLDLEAAAQQIETLQGIIPICAWCKAVRDDDGFWEDVETYVRGRTEAEFTHSICPDCKVKHFPDVASAEKAGE